MNDTKVLSGLFMHFLEQLITQHEAEDPQAVYQTCADLCQRRANRLDSLNPARNKYQYCRLSAAVSFYALLGVHLLIKLHDHARR